MSVYKGDKLVAGGSNISDSPDWAKAVLLDTAATYMNGYTAPGRGIIVGWFKFKYRTAILDLRVNNITVARANMPTTTATASFESSVQCPVGKDDSINLITVQGSLASSDINTSLYFVPYKAQ